MSDAVNDGGPAFPCPTDNEYGRDFGMSLRDYFAAQAMAQLITLPAMMATSADGEAYIAQYAYRQADAMLKARVR